MFDYSGSAPDAEPVPPGRPKQPLDITADERLLLEDWARARVTEDTGHLDRRSRQALALRAKIVLLAAEGHTNRAAAAATGASLATVSKWRSRFVNGGLLALLQNPRSGLPLPDAMAYQVIERSRKLGWSTREIAEDVRVSQSSVVRLLRRSKLK